MSLSGANARVERSPRNGEPLKAARSEVYFRSNELLAPRESARGAVSRLFVKNNSGERNRRADQLGRWPRAQRGAYN
jgi:hypothetical protein